MRASTSKTIPGGTAATGFILWTILLAAHPFAQAQPAPESGTDGRYAILLAGASGNEELQKTYLDEIRKLHSILVGPLGFAHDSVITLFDSPEMDPERIQHKSTRKEFEQACLKLAGRKERASLVFLFIEGHGSYDGKTYKLNLVGPDSTARELADALYSIPADRFVVANATSASGGSLPAFSGRGSIILTSTKSGMERNQTNWGRYFIESLENNAADSNKDGRVSMLEAFLYAGRKVEEYYKNEGNLQTEHAILDDNGDAQGQTGPNTETGDGLLAVATFLDGGIGRDRLESMTPEERELALQAGDLENQIEVLKSDKARMDPSEYETKLEELLLKLARINAKMEN